MVSHDGHALSARRPSDKGALAWLSANRLWLVPLLSALLVVAVEVMAGFSGRPLPIEAHTVLGMFWVFAVGRTGQREAGQRRRDERLVGLARRQGISVGLARDELALLEALLERNAIAPPIGRRDDDHGR